MQFPHSVGKKIRFILSTCHPMAFYGVATSAVDEGMLAAYTSPVARVSNPNNNHSVATVFSSATDSPDSGPSTYMIEERCGLMRSILHKWPDSQQQTMRMSEGP